jgi:hypothetical protein
MTDLQFRASVYRTRRPRRFSPYQVWGLVLTVGSLLVAVMMLLVAGK